MARLNRFFLGGVIGAGLALLFAPKSGGEIRRMLMRGNPKALPAYDATDYLDFPSEEAKEEGAEQMKPAEEEIAPADKASEEIEKAWEALSKPAEGEPTLETPPAGSAQPQEAKTPAPSGIGHEEIRRRLDETRARLKARAFEARENQTDSGKAGEEEKPEKEARNLRESTPEKE